MRPLPRFEDMYAVEDPRDMLPEAPPEENVDPDVLHRGHFFEKIKFAWDPQDQTILDQIQGAADDEFADLFAEALGEIDSFYESLRVPKLRNGMPVYDAHKRQVWETDAAGKPLECWDQLTGQDIEQTLMNLQRIKMTIAPTVNKLKNEAIYAKMVAGDARDEVRVPIKAGTGDDKAARANKESRVDRYHAFFRYVLWSTADVFQRELVDFCFRLQKVRDWNIWDRKND